MERERQPPEAVFDDDNPEWTEADFARAIPVDGDLRGALAKLRATRGAQKAPTKKLVSLRVDQDVLERFRATGPGWQSRMNEALRKAVS